MEHPAIDPCVYLEPYGWRFSFRTKTFLTFCLDLQTMIESLKFNRQLLKTSPFKDVISGKWDVHLYCSNMLTKRLRGGFSW